MRVRYIGPAIPCLVILSMFGLESLNVMIKKHLTGIKPGKYPGLIGLVILVIFSGNLLYLVGQYRYPLDIYSWEVPEGGGNHQESNLDAAKRELKEETGLTANKWTYLDSLYTSNSITNEIGHIFMAEDLEEGQSEPEHTEDLTIKVVPFFEAYRMVLEFEIKDSLAIIGIIRVYDYLRKEGRI